MDVSNSKGQQLHCRSSVSRRLRLASCPTALWPRAHLEIIQALEIFLIERHWLLSGSFMRMPVSVAKRKDIISLRLSKQGFVEK